MNVGFCLFGFGIFAVGYFLGAEMQRAGNRADDADVKRRQDRGMDIVKRTHLDDHERGYSVN